MADSIEMCTTKPRGKFRRLAYEYGEKPRTYTDVSPLRSQLYQQPIEIDCIDEKSIT